MFNFQKTSAEKFSSRTKASMFLFCSFVAHMRLAFLCSRITFIFVFFVWKECGSPEGCAATKINPARRKEEKQETDNETEDSEHAERLGSFLGLLISFALDHRLWPDVVHK